MINNNDFHGIQYDDDDDNNDELNTNAILQQMTLFEPMGCQPLIRDLPHYSWYTYALLGIAGATSCALTHTVVIPLDGTIRNDVPHYMYILCVSKEMISLPLFVLFLLLISRKNPSSNMSYERHD
jgi:hypothetical protein